MYVLGKKLPKYPAEEKEVLSLMERVADSKRIAIGVIYWFMLALLALKHNKRYFSLFEYVFADDNVCFKSFTSSYCYYGLVYLACFNVAFTHCYNLC